MTVLIIMGAMVFLVGFIDPVSIGLIVGSVAGTGAGLYEGEQQKKEQKKAAEAAGAPKRRRLHALTQQQQAAHEQRMAGMSMLAQAANDWANNLRY